MANNNLLFLLLLLLLLPIGYYFYTRNSNQSVVSTTPNDPNTSIQNPLQSGGKRNKKSKSLKSKLKSGSMTTTGIYLLLGAIIIGYIVSYF